MTALYRLYDDRGVLLYVGISFSALRRFSEHAQEKVWWPLVSAITVQRYATRAEALVAEARAIIQECPLYNLHGHTDESTPLMPMPMDLSRLAPFGHSWELTAWGWLGLASASVQLVLALIWYAAGIFEFRRWNDPAAVVIFFTPAVIGALSVLAVRHVVQDQPQPGPPVREYLMAALVGEGT